MVFLPFFLTVAALAFLATLRAMATACFWGLPDFISLRMLLETVFREYPFFNGIILFVLHKVKAFLNAVNRVTHFYKGQFFIFLKMGGGVHLWDQWENLDETLF